MLGRVVGVGAAVGSFIGYNWWQNNVPNQGLGTDVLEFTDGDGVNDSLITEDIIDPTLNTPNVIASTNELQPVNMGPNDPSVIVEQTNFNQVQVTKEDFASTNPPSELKGDSSNINAMNKTTLESSQASQGITSHNQEVTATKNITGFQLVTGAFALGHLCQSFSMYKLAPEVKGKEYYIRQIANALGFTTSALNTFCNDQVVSMLKDVGMDVSPEGVMLAQIVFSGVVYYKNAQWMDSLKSEATLQAQIEENNQKIKNLQKQIQEAKEDSKENKQTNANMIQSYQSEIEAKNAKHIQDIKDCDEEKKNSCEAYEKRIADLQKKLEFYEQKNEELTKQLQVKEGQQNNSMEQ
jgi:hypothetical protein